LVIGTDAVAPLGNYFLPAIIITRLPEGVNHAICNANKEHNAQQHSDNIIVPCQQHVVPTYHRSNRTAQLSPLSIILNTPHKPTTTLRCEQATL